MCEPNELRAITARLIKVYFELADLEEFLTDRHEDDLALTVHGIAQMVFSTDKIGSNNAL